MGVGISEEGNVQIAWLSGRYSHVERISAVCSKSFRKSRFVASEKTESHLDSRVRDYFQCRERSCRRFLLDANADFPSEGWTVSSPYQQKADEGEIQKKRDIFFEK